MKVSDVMTRDVGTCRPEDDLNRVAKVMWDRDCGVVPVVDLADHVVGMITDRDACMAAYTKGAVLGAIRVGDAMAQQVFSCRTDDDVADAAATMQRQRVRRLPVLDGDGRFVGIVSLNDLARRSAKESTRGSDVLLREVGRTLATICKPWSELADAQERGAAAEPKRALVTARAR